MTAVDGINLNVNCRLIYASSDLFELLSFRHHKRCKFSNISGDSNFCQNLIIQILKIKLRLAFIQLSKMSKLSLVFLIFIAAGVVAQTKKKNDIKFKETVVQRRDDKNYDDDDKYEKRTKQTTVSDEERRKQKNEEYRKKYEEQSKGKDNSKGKDISQHGSNKTEEQKNKYKAWKVVREHSHIT